MSTDKRQHPRKVIEAEVAFQVGDGTRVEARCRDVSLGGMFIETTTPLAYGSKVQLVMRLPGMYDAPIEAIVRWSKPDGMGVQFGVMGARETHALTLLLAG